MKTHRHVTVAFTHDEYDSLQRMAIAAYASPRMSGVAKVIEAVMRDVIQDEIADKSGEYDRDKDFAGSLEVGYEAIRERMATGGKGWEPKA